MLIHRWMVIILLLTGFCLMKRQNMICVTNPLDAIGHVVLKKDLDSDASVSCAGLEAPDQEEAVLQRTTPRVDPIVIVKDEIASDCSSLHHFTAWNGEHVSPAHHDYLFRLKPF